MYPVHILLNGKSCLINSMYLKFLSDLLCNVIVLLSCTMSSGMSCRSRFNAVSCLVASFRPYTPRTWWAESITAPKMTDNRDLVWDCFLENSIVPFIDGARCLS